MNVMQAVRQRLGRLIAGEPSPFMDPNAEWVFPGRRNASGVRLEGNAALSIAAVWACVRVISEAMAALPVHVVERRGDRRDVVETHPAGWLLSVSPDEVMPATAWIEAITAHALMRGNGYASIRRRENGEPVSLHLELPDRVRVRLAEPGETIGGIVLRAGEVVYEVQTDGGETQLVRGGDMFHFRGLGYDGLQGYSVVEFARQSMGMSSALETFGASFFGKGARPAGVLATDQALKPEQVEQLRDQWEKAQGGPRNAQRTAVLGGGLKWMAVDVPPEEAQFLESRRFQVLEICRWFRVPPHMVAELERATHSNVEQMSIEFVQYALLPWVRRFETEAALKLLGRNQRGRMQIRFNLAGLLRGDLKTRYEAYAIGRQNGWLSPNDVRRLEDLNPIAGGDDYHVQVNLTPLDTLRRKVEREIERADAPSPEPVEPDPANPEDDDSPDVVATMASRLKLINGGADA
jgi:HK97 family phage portal protein